MKPILRAVVIIIAIIGLPLWICYGAWLGMKMEWRRFVDIWRQI